MISELKSAPYLIRRCSEQLLRCSPGT